MRARSAGGAAGRGRSRFSVTQRGGLSLLGKGNGEARARRRCRVGLASGTASGVKLTGADAYSLRSGAFTRPEAAARGVVAFVACDVLRMPMTEVAPLLVRTVPESQRIHDTLNRQRSPTPSRCRSAARRQRHVGRGDRSNRGDGRGASSSYVHTIPVTFGSVCGVVHAWERFHLRTASRHQSNSQGDYKQGQRGAPTHRIRLPDAPRVRLPVSRSSRGERPRSMEVRGWRNGQATGNVILGLVRPRCKR